RWPSCATQPLGMLARGDASTRFALTRFLPLGSAPLDEPCRGKPQSRSHQIQALVRIPNKADKAQITVGATAVSVQVGPRPATPATAAPAKPAASAATAPASPAKPAATNAGAL